MARCRTSFFEGSCLLGFSFQRAYSCGSYCTCGSSRELRDRRSCSISLLIPSALAIQSCNSLISFSVRLAELRDRCSCSNFLIIADAPAIQSFNSLISFSVSPASARNALVCAAKSIVRTGAAGAFLAASACIFFIFSSCRAFSSRISFSYFFRRNSGSSPCGIQDEPESWSILRLLWETFVTEYFFSTRPERVCRSAE